MCQSLFSNKIADQQPTSLLKKRFRHMRFPVNFAKFLVTSFLQNISGRRLLLHSDCEIAFRFYVTPTALSILAPT